MTDSHTQSTGQRHLDGRTWFVRLYALAVIAHIAGNRPLELNVRGVVTLILGLAAAVLFVEARRTPLLAAVAGLVIATAWIQAPVLGNHWLVMALVSLAMLFALTRADWWAVFAPTGRWILLAFYAFAAFAKLNRAFFDSTASCGVFYANQNLGSWGLPEIQVGTGLAVAVAILTAAVELSVPALLLFARSRRFGVALGYLFHFAISVDLDQHFYDFTAVLFALFALFLDDAARADLERAAAPHIERLGRFIVLVMAVFVVASVVEPSTLTLRLLLDGVFVVWVPVGLVIVVATLRRLSPDMPVDLRIPNLVGGAIVALVLVNALTPYLEIKSTFGFHMYSNLEIADGESNHLIIPGSLPLTAGNETLITIVATNDPTLQSYVDSGWRVPIANIRHHLADAPGATVDYAIGDADPTDTGTLTAETDGRRMPLLEEKMFRFRSLSDGPPRQCQAVWLPAL